ncbi:MAG: hypothetical protein NC935_04245, partial [Candidatus Omnitrophica bacterium]|nr:hypothetical protein [Candidatus Omnitrophota bacterium]
MYNIIFSNNKKLLDKILKKINISELYIIRIKYDSCSKEIIDYLKSKGITTDFIRGNNFVNDYDKIYRDFIGNLNVENNSLFWWALNLTNKNPITTYLCDRVYHMILINRIISVGKYNNILIIDDDDDLYKQIKIIFGKNKDVNIINAIKKYNFKKIIKDIFPAAIIYAFLITILQKIISLIYIKRKIKVDRLYLVIMSLLYSPSFKNNRYHDLYFGKFADYLSASKVNFISLIWIFDSYREMLKKANSFAEEYNIYPKEYFVCFKSISVCFFISLKKFFSQFKIKNVLELYGIDLSYLLNRYIRYEYNSTRFFNNILVFYSIKDLCSKCKHLSRFYYPFENRSFEKMIILALRKFSPQTKIIGYQHASLSLRHTNFLLTKEEAKITPLPDLIITMGEITRNIMIEMGNFPSPLVKTGCALRQANFTGRLKKRRSPISNLFVALATGIEEYIKVIKFLEIAFSRENHYDIWIRPHPVFSLEEAIKLIGGVKFKFHK